MGLFYEHITVRGPRPEVLADYLRESDRNGYISPTIDDVTVIYDQISSADVALIFELARDLSARFACPALAVHIHDSDVMFYQLYRDGCLLDTYNSLPGYFDDTAEGSLPSGGDAAILCSAFCKPGAVAEVEAVLRHDNDTDAGGGELWPAEERHAKLSRALGWPSFVPFIGYDFIATGGFDGSFDASPFIRLGS